MFPRLQTLIVATPHRFRSQTVMMLDVDATFVEINGWGRYQKLMYFLLCIPTSIAGAAVISLSWTGFNMKYRSVCYPTECVVQSGNIEVILRSKAGKGRKPDILHMEPFTLSGISEKGVNKASVWSDVICLKCRMKLNVCLYPTFLETPLSQNDLCQMLRPGLYSAHEM